MAARRALLAWELGAAYGHLASLRAVARVLRQSGHACAFAVRHVGVAVEMLPPDLGPVVQAPARLTAARNPVRTQVSYASLLHNIGFDDPLELAGRIRAWRDLMRALRTELVFAEHSPVALIAARSLQLPCVAIGNGFTLPPQLRPFPSFRPRLRLTPEVLRHNEAEVLKELNQALERLKLPPCASLQDIFAHAQPALLSYPELDHYDGERPEPFLGHPVIAQGAAPPWPAGKGPKLFAYLRPGPALAPALEALAAAPARVIVRVADVPGAALAQFVRKGLVIVDQAIDFASTAASSDAYLSYAAHGTICEFLLAGKPGLLIPGQHEQLLLARRVVALGAGVQVQGHSGIGPALVQLLDDDSLRQGAAAFAARQAGIDRGQILPGVVERALAALAQRR